jgi:hypothetical protein
MSGYCYVRLCTPQGERKEPTAAAQQPHPAPTPGAARVAANKEQRTWCCGIRGCEKHSVGAHRPKMAQPLSNPQVLPCVRHFGACRQARARRPERLMPSCGLQPLSAHLRASQVVCLKHCFQALNVPSSFLHRHRKLAGKLNR